VSGATGSLLDEVRARLNARGERMTKPRLAVLGVLVEDGRHLSAEEVVAAVAERDPAVHRATVYRTLDALADLGVVQHVHLSHGATAYHLVRDSSHVHLQCTACHSIQDVPLDALAGVAGTIEGEYGFRVDVGHVALSGTCAGCR
jgi:Fe2+ or Zn2+ uptake regulation protein